MQLVYLWYVIAFLKKTNKNQTNINNMQKIDEPKEFETNNSQFPKWIIYIIIIIAVTIFKIAAKKEIRDNANENIENTYNGR